jgi:hypothetical protein
MNTVWAIYFLGVLIFVPYYNWQYAKSSGFVRWLILGELVATGKGVVWPYFLFRGQSKLDDTPEEAPPLSSTELDRYSEFLASTQNRLLTDSDLAQLREILQDYKTRTGSSHISKKQYEDFVDALKLSNDYQFELAQSALFSWDRKEFVTTNSFDELRVKMKPFRKEALLAKDINVIHAAAQNQDFVEAPDGSRYAFGRNMILESLRSAEVERTNIDKIAAVFREFVM